LIKLTNQTLNTQIMIIERRLLMPSKSHNSVITANYVVLTFFVLSNSDASDEYSSPPSRLDADGCRASDVCSMSTDFVFRLLQ